MFSKVQLIKDDKKEYKLVVMISTENEGTTLVHQQAIALGDSLSEAFTELMGQNNLVEFKGVAAIADKEIIEKALAEQAELAAKKKAEEEAALKAEEEAKLAAELEVLAPVEIAVEA